MIKDFLQLSITAVIGFFLLLAIEVTSPAYARDSVMLIMLVYVCIELVAWLIFAIWYIKIGRKKNMEQEEEED